MKGWGGGGDLRSQCFLPRRILISPPPPMLPDTLSDDIESSLVPLCVHVPVPALSSVSRFLISGSRQRRQRPSRSEPGSRSLQRGPGSSPEESIMQERYQTMNYLRRRCPPFSCPRTQPPCPAGRPPACRCLHLLMNDYCIS